MGGCCTSSIVREHKGTEDVIKKKRTDSRSKLSRDSDDGNDDDDSGSFSLTLGPTTAITPEIHKRRPRQVSILEPTTTTSDSEEHDHHQTNNNNHSNSNNDNNNSISTLYLNSSTTAYGGAACGVTNNNNTSSSSSGILNPRSCCNDSSDRSSTCSQRSRSQSVALTHSHGFVWMSTRESVWSNPTEVDIDAASEDMEEEDGDGKNKCELDDQNENEASSSAPRRPLLGKSNSTASSTGVLYRVPTDRILQFEDEDDGASGINEQTPALRLSQEEDSENWKRASVVGVSTILRQLLRGGPGSPTTPSLAHSVTFSTVSDMDASCVPALVTEVISGYDADGNKTLNQYAIIGELGRGAYGKVKAAIDTTTEQIVAIKILRRCTSRRGLAVLESQRREVAVMEKLYHPNLVRLISVVDDPGAAKLYLVMEHVGGGTLQKAIANSGERFNAITCRSQFLDVLHGLQYLHNKNIVHMDVKPENILICEDGSTKLSDFGVSAMIDGNFECDEDVMHNVKGTPMFHAPEVVRGDPFHGKANDVWAFGVTLYFSVYGTMPFSNSTMRQLYDEIESKQIEFPPLSYRGCPNDDALNEGSNFFVEVPSDFIDVMQGCLTRDPTMRLTVRQILGSAFFCSNPPLEVLVRNWKLFHFYTTIEQHSVGSARSFECAALDPDVLSQHLHCDSASTGSSAQPMIQSDSPATADSPSLFLQYSPGGMGDMTATSDTGSNSTPRKRIRLKDNTDRSGRRSVGAEALLSTLNERELSSTVKFNKSQEGDALNPSRTHTQNNDES
eukprot:PhM_4_TR3461/c0_g1_i1/m.60260/K07359/CAMKK2; calcium/calmodulin-dependent protein kinase kinase 2